MVILSVASWQARDPGPQNTRREWFEGLNLRQTRDFVFGWGPVSQPSLYLRDIKRLK